MINYEDSLEKYNATQIKLKITKMKFLRNLQFLNYHDNKILK